MHDSVDIYLKMLVIDKSFLVAFSF